LHFSYAEKPILRGISLRAEAGEVEVEGIDEGGY
jgi:ABC-type histidine transport system ATPase subunit